MSAKRPPAAPTMTLTAEDDAALKAATRHARLPPRYVDLGVIGQGGMGEVRRVFDQVLRRTLAMKLIRPEQAERPRARRRFLREAQITAGLSHPGIVAVHDQGTLPDGRLWYTMQAVEGQTLGDVLADRPRRRLIEILAQVARAVGSAHRQRIVHRDLKPSNIMIGAYGEVLVLDWGIAVRLDEGPLGVRAGTPGYMAPEQATDQPIGPESDVYALGAVLHEVLTGEPPLDGVTVDPASPLGQTCQRALAQRPRARFADGLLFADALQAWLDGAERRAAAERIFAEAQALLAPIADARAKAVEHERAATAILDPLPAHAPVNEKRPGWRLAQVAQSHARAARLLEIEMVQKARAALEQDETYGEPRALLADLYRARVLQAEAARDADAAAENLALLRAQDDGRYASWIAGHGRITLQIASADAHLRVWRITEQDRRLQRSGLVFEGPAPLRDLEVERGAWLIEVEPVEGCPFVVPAWVERDCDWHAGPPAAPHRPIRVPDLLADDEAYVPAGWFAAGGDRLAVDGFEHHRLWVDGFVMKRHPVTNADYLGFLNDLVDQGQGEQALAYVPRYAVGVIGEQRPVYGQDEAGRFFACDDLLGESWALDNPVASVDWFSAMAYAEWLSARTGSPWRLPHGLEWEKAARGVDGRFFPWGDTFEPTWTQGIASSAGQPKRGSVYGAPDDSSPYGVQGLSGNVRDWCINAFMRRPLPDGSVLRVEPARGGGFRSVRGGSVFSEPDFCRCAARFGAKPDQRRTSLGFRLVRSIEAAG